MQGGHPGSSTTSSAASTTSSTSTLHQSPIYSSSLPGAKFTASTLSPSFPHMQMYGSSPKLSCSEFSESDLVIGTEDDPFNSASNLYPHTLA